MKAVIQVNSRTYNIQIDQPLDISIPLRASKENVNAWYLPPPKIYPSVINKSVVSISEGAAVNFNTIEFNPHAHGTHTECVGHITKELYTINDCLTQFLFVTELITVVPESFEDDFIISEKQLRYALGNKKREAINPNTMKYMKYFNVCSQPTAPRLYCVKSGDKKYPIEAAAVT